MSDIEIHRGLAGVVVDTTSVSNVVPETNSLTYRGYAVQDLAANCSFEEVAYLIWHGELPDRGATRRVSAPPRAPSARSARLLISIVDQLPTTCHPMDVLRTAVSVLGAEDPSEADISAAASLDKSVAMFAKLPTGRRSGLPTPSRARAHRA